MKLRDDVRFKRRGSRARRRRMQMDAQWRLAAERMAAGKPWRIAYPPPDPGEPVAEFGGWPKGWKELGAIEDQPPPTFRPALPETEVGRRLKDFHREHPGLGRRGYSADFYILDEPWRYDA